MAGTSVITIGDNGEYRFGAAHCGLHGTELEPLHGHTYLVTLRLHGPLDEAAMVCDFADVQEGLAAVIAPLKRRTLIAGCMPHGQVRRQGGQVVVDCGAKHYSLPGEDVVVLPVVNTTTEALAGWLLAEVTARFRPHGIHAAELVLHESPAASARAMAILDGRA